ncbi:hypothetical protein [Methanobacterium petrolearium]|uniref:hypothetical protein n=1 Tax=Methanobacterium petrolearium TaxID=710190 RepID=UPI001AE1A7D5|nr:hypothetical protein [Methanobacterium petrolearium]MBP1944781.1 hypothetical protein [Methanobacterium petrolearium]BDZ70055.1 hypothetical protein GCM10025861_05720 [Methanobacterium petrolearium]
MNNKNNLAMVIGIIILILLVSNVFISFFNNSTKTFSDAYISFNYPTDFENADYSSNDTNSSFPLELIAYFENTAPLKVQNMMVFKNISTTSTSEMKDRTILRVKNDSTCKLLSPTNETNPNGVFVEKLTYSYEYTAGRLVSSEMYFKINNGIYVIAVYGPDTTIGNQVINETTQTIFQSIK